MSEIKKEVLLFCIFIFLFLVSLNSAYADEVGCCSNPGASALTCSTDRLALRDKECCPKPESSFPSYYKSQQNPDGPTNTNDCITAFFFPNKACSTVEACALGCCCSELGGTITPEAQCKGTGLTFHKGETNCNQVCPIPQCNDGLDNDNNGCADFEGGDLGCASPADKEERGGSCVKEGVGCSNPSYIPKLSSLEITPVKGQRKFLLNWKDECRETAVSYDVLRCKDSGCTNFVIVGITNTNSFEDVSGDLLFDTIYTYQIKSRYNLQLATPTITKTATLGNIECLDRFASTNFCIHESYYNKYRNYLATNFPEFSKSFAASVKTKFGDKLNKAFFCDVTNKLIAEGTVCSSTQICVVNNNKPSCLSKVSCNYNDANPFGLFYTQQTCEQDRYCFYDRSHSTVDSCFGCDPSMACYDYKTEEACTRDNCKVGNCKWKNMASQIGIGACVSTTEYNCQWCEKKGTATLENLRAFNEVFDFCTRDKSNVLSEGNFKCYSRNGKSKNCDDVICKDYEPEQCSSAQILHDENNRIKNPSLDECGIKVCQNINNLCVKNADGDSKADCATVSCEADYFISNTTLLPVIKKGIVDSLIIQIYDRTSINSSVILKTSSDYFTFLCAEPCGENGHPYNASLSSRIIIITNLNAFDGSNGNKLLTLSEGTNVVRYYSQDPAKNIGEIKKLVVEAHDKTDGPRIFSINITDGTKVLDKFYTSNQKPTIDVQFFEPAIVTYSRLINKKTGLIVSLQVNTELSTKVSFSITETLPNGDYTLELNAKNKNNIFMDPALSQIIVIDNNKPIMNFIPSAGAIINTSIVTIKLTFDKEVNLENVKINSEDIKNSFSTTDNKVFTATINLTDGNKNLEVAARDYAKNQVSGTVIFIVDANPAVITLVSPRFGTASKSIFDVIVETDNDATCKFSLDNNFEFDFMEPFTTAGGTSHKIPNFNKIASGDTSTHKLNIRCKDQKGTSFKSFDINVDTSPPNIKSAFAFPNPIIEKPSSTTLTIEADEPVICKSSNNSKEFDKMEGKFESFDDNNFKIIHKQLITVENEGNYLYYVACKNKAELISEVKEIPFKVDLTIPIAIISHTPEYFNSTNVVLAIETNKKSQCKFSETDSTAQNGEIFGAPGYSHTRQLTSSPGKHTFFIVCKDQYLQKFSDVATVIFTIDITPPTILSVNDSSTLADKPEFTFSTDYLRVKWNSIDNESRVSSHLYSLAEYGTARIILNNTQSSLNNEWVIASKPNSTGLGLVNGNRYFFRVKSQNIVGLFSNISESDGVTVDTSLKPLNCTNGIKDEKETDVDCGGICGPCKPKTTCGDGTVQKPNSAEINEECDKSNLDGKNCNDIDKYKDGNLRCKGDCTFDTTGCVQSENPMCGDNAVNQLSEDCDGQALKGKTCQSFGYGSGILRCSNCKFDTSGCTNPKQDVCGDGTAKNPNSAGFGEQCDKSDLQQKTCASFDAYKSGALACRSDCTFDFANCELKHPPEKCGDNAVNQLSEDCDNTDFKGSTCLNLGYDSGNLKCTSDCKLDKSSCIVKEYKCVENTDCITGYCRNGLCSAPKCDDSTRNQDETDVDCGGSCKKCQNNQVCNINNDCESGYCSFGFCKPQEICSDGKLSPAEADVDCGGPCPTKCFEGKSCNLNDDCGEGLQCISSFCKRCEENDKNCNGIPDEQEGKVIKDTDGDGLPDDWEIENGLNPNDPNDSNLDSDKDGLTNLEEYNVQKTYGKSTNPNLEDTDGDKFTDKEEVDKGTSPIDATDFPKSNLGKILTFVLGIVILISGFGYLAYKVIEKRKKESFELPKQRELPKYPQQQVKQPAALQKQKEEVMIKEALKKKEEQKEKEREKLFEVFGKEEKPKEEAKKLEKQELKEFKEEKKPIKEIKKERKKQKIKPKEDVFVKLKEIAKEKSKKEIKSKQKDKMAKLYELTKSKKPRK